MGNISYYIDRIHYMAANKALAGVIVHLNDTYRIEDQRQSTDPKSALCIPSFARVASLIERLRGLTIDTIGEVRVLVVHSGDFLGPSYLSRSDLFHPQWHKPS